MSFRVSSRTFGIVVGMLVVLGAFGLGLPSTAFQDDSTVTVFLVRHAEKLTDDRDPDLSPEGINRADRLRDMLSDQTIDAVFVTRTNRSHQTGDPTADAAGVQPTEYPPTDMNGLVESINAIEGGGSVLVVAHSNTLPMVLEALGGREMPELDESEYDRFIAVVRDDGEHVKTIELRF